MKPANFVGRTPLARLASTSLLTLFFTTLVGLVAFCVLFGLPFLSRFSAGKVLAWAGCTAPTFDMQAVCPSGSFAEPFIPLGHWMTSFFSPIVLIHNFGGMLLAWAAISVGFGLLWLTLKFVQADSVS